MSTTQCLMLGEQLRHAEALIDACRETVAECDRLLSEPAVIDPYTVHRFRDDALADIQTYTARADRLRKAIKEDHA